MVKKVKDMYDNMLKVGCTGCNYCSPCPSGVQIPDIFSLYNDVYLFGRADESSGFYKRLQGAGKDASKCVECGQCEGACPQHLSIRDRLKDAHKVLSK